MSIRKLGLLLIMIGAFFLIACNKDITKEVEDDILKNAGKESMAEDSQGPEIPSPISGIYAAENKVDRRPIAVMLDNHPKARWQAGISQAEIVYEYLVEGGYTRYMAIFLINDPESIGPIRSARPYFISSLLEYDSIYVRVGGSPQAKSDIIELGVDDIDGLVVPSHVLWRENGKKEAPHNVYTSMETLRSYQTEIGYSDKGDYGSFKFNESDMDLEGVPGENIIINYSRDNKTAYSYDPGDRLYIGEKDGLGQKDELDDSLVRVKNIIIQEANTRVIDDAGRLFIDIIGEGKGKYISNGKMLDINWEKKSRSNKTLYYDDKGREIRLNPGNTWIHVVKPDSSIDIQ